LACRVHIALTARKLERLVLGDRSHARRLPDRGLLPIAVDDSDFWHRRGDAMRRRSAPPGLVGPFRPPHHPRSSRPSSP
jgi:hypothetical protein